MILLRPTLLALCLLVAVCCVTGKPAGGGDLEESPNKDQKKWRVALKDLEESPNKDKKKWETAPKDLKESPIRDRMKWRAAAPDDLGDSSEAED